MSPTNNNFHNFKPLQLINLANKTTNEIVVYVPNMMTFPTHDVRLFDKFGDHVNQHNITCIFQYCFGNVAAFLTEWNTEYKGIG